MTRTIHLTQAPKYTRFVAYYRVSTAQQGRSGLGLDAQREAVRVFLAGCADEPAEAFTEIESGKNADRPQLARALDACRLTGGVLVIAKLDRLSRDAHFLLGLEKAGVEFVAADMPNANRLTWRRKRNLFYKEFAQIPNGSVQTLLRTTCISEAPCCNSLPIA